MQLEVNPIDVHRPFDPAVSPAGQIAVYRIEDFERPASFPHVRRDFYKIELLCNAEGVLSYADQRVPVAGCALIFVNPLIPYSWERLSGRETGYVCLFKEAFITPPLRTSPVADSPLFRVGANPVLFPPPESLRRLHDLFEQMLVEIGSDYTGRHFLVRNYVELLIHESLKLETVQPLHPLGTSASRISMLFLELLSRQFPIATPQHTLPLKNANEFARQLGVHTNHLNKALKEMTGKTTTEHIAERVIQEAKALLHHSNWSLADIGYCLGFEHASNFNSFFRKHTRQPAGQYRRQSVVD